MPVNANENYMDVRCHSCGMLLGGRKRQGSLLLWCSEECSDTPMAKYRKDQVRDEVVVELFLQGEGIMAISKLLDDWPYQYVQQTLSRRGLNVQEVTRKAS